MARNRYRPEEIAAKLCQADVLPGEGRKVPEIIGSPRVEMGACSRSAEGLRRSLRRSEGRHVLVLSRDSRRGADGKHEYRT
jgi:hypothetical protein